MARVISFIKRSRAAKEKAVFGRGGGFVIIKLTAVIAASPQGTQRIPVRHETRRALAGMLAAALFLPIVLELAARLLKQLRRSPSGSP